MTKRLKQRLRFPLAEPGLHLTANSGAQRHRPDGILGMYRTLRISRSLTVPYEASSGLANRSA